MVPGDVIVEAAGKPVDTQEAVAKSIAAASESITLKVVNSTGERRDVTVPVAKTCWWLCADPTGAQIGTPGKRAKVL
jgi:hypothetical protein